MKEYIEREWLVNDALAVLDFRKKYYMDKARIADAASTVEWLKYYAPAADVVSKAAFDQVLWERDVAIQQLREDYGVGLGEKKADDVVERKRGEWIDHCVRDWHCSECGKQVPKQVRFDGHCYDDKLNFCPNCGADMRGENNG